MSSVATPRQSSGPGGRPGRGRHRAHRPPQLAVLGEQVAVGGHVGQQLAVPADGDDASPASSATRSASSTVDGRWATTSAVVCASTAQRRLDQRLGVHVEGRQRVVEHQHRRPAEHGAGQRQPLPLAAGQRQALLADAAWPGPTAGRGRTPPAPPAAPRPTSASVASGRPRVRFSRTLIENSVASSKAVATTLRSWVSGRSRTSTPSRVTRPEVTS